MIEAGLIDLKISTLSIFTVLCARILDISMQILKRAIEKLTKVSLVPKNCKLFCLCAMLLAFLAVTFPGS